MSLPSAITRPIASFATTHLSRSFSTNPRMAAAEVKRLGVVGAGQMVCLLSLTRNQADYMTGD